MIRLLADVNVSGRVVERLRALGWSVERSTDHVVASAADDAVLDLATSRGMVLVTRDQDFAALLASSGARQPSVVNIRCATVEPDALAALVDAALREAATELAAGAIVTIDDTAARVHRLPLG